MVTKEELIKQLFEKGILLNKELLDNSSEATLTDMLTKAKSEDDLLVLNDDNLSFVGEQKTLVDWHEIDRYRVEAEKERNDQLYQTELQTPRQVNLNTPDISSMPGSFSNTSSAFKSHLFSSLETELVDQGASIFIEPNNEAILSPNKNIKEDSEDLNTTATKRTARDYRNWPSTKEKRKRKSFHYRSS